MVYCVAIGCNNNTKSKTSSQTSPDPKLSFHTFPRDKELRLQWIQKIRRANWKPSKHSRLCSEHFTNDQFTDTPDSDNVQMDCSTRRRRTLKAHAVPTTFTHVIKHPTSVDAAEREERVHKRQKTMEVD